MSHTFHILHSLRTPRDVWFATQKMGSRGRGIACWIWGQNLPVDLSAQLSRVTPSPPATPKGVPAWNHMKLSQQFLDACTNPMNKNTWLRKAVSSTLFGELVSFYPSSTPCFSSKNPSWMAGSSLCKRKMRQKVTKSYKKLQKIHPNYSGSLFQKQTTATPQDDPISKQIKTSADPSDSKPTQFGFVLQSSLGGEVVTIESHEPWEIGWFPGFRELSGKRYFSCIFNFGPKNKNKHVKTMKETTRIFLQFLLGLSKFVKSFLVVRLKGFPTKNQEWTNHLENLLAFYLSVGWPTFCHWKKQAEMIHPWSVWASPKGYFLRKGDWKTILTTPYLLGLC